MKIALDLQGAQSNSRHRGIGRYTLSMAKAFAKVASAHELWLVLNGRHVDSTVELVEQFHGLIPRSRIVVRELPQDIAGCIPDNQIRARIAEAVQADLFADMNADCIWHSSMFEGWGDDSIAALGAGEDDERHVATLYDLIPLLHPDRYLHDPKYQHWYYRRLGLLKRCGLLLAISESSRSEVIERLDLEPSRVAVVHAAADEAFKPMPASGLDWERWRGDYGIRPGFLLYAGGYDAHKNVDALIAAYAELPVVTRQKHVLVLAGRCDPLVERQLRIYSRRAGLSEGAVLFTGGVEDAELAKLYSSCELFVAPSLHEGFGLPALEAMACGAAVIGSNTASLPEVIGRADALFNPRSISAMVEKMQHVLSDAAMRKQLREYGRLRAGQFAWSDSARRALEAIENHLPGKATTTLRGNRPRLIYVSPLPPERSGIADYSARLLRELATHYDIDVVADQLEVRDPWVRANFPIRSLEWLKSPVNADLRILYHVGNSPLHAGMFEALRERPGVVVLHDFFLGAVRNWMAHQARDDRLFKQDLYRSHGYPALLRDLHYGRGAAINTYPVSLEVIDAAQGVIVHSHHAVDLARRRYGPVAASKFMVAPFSRAVTHGDRDSSRRALGIGADDYVVCSFGMLAPTKMNHRLLDAWLQSSLAEDLRCHLIFVGENHGGDYGRELLAVMHAAKCRRRLHITGFVDANRYTDYLAACDVAVQLRTDSRGETSAAIFDVMAQGIPLIVNAHGSSAELSRDVTLQIDDAFADDDLVVALQCLHQDESLRMTLGKAGQEWVRERHHPAKAASRYKDAIELLARRSAGANSNKLLADLQRYEAASTENARLLADARDLVVLNRHRPYRPRMFVDVTATSSSTLHTGIERVVRGVLSQLLRDENLPWRVEPVKLVDGRYVFAHAYALHLIDHPDVGLLEAEVRPDAGDLLLGLDWVADKLPANASLLAAWRARGVRIVFTVYDLLPVLRPQWFPAEIAPMHARWLACIGRYADALIGISKSVVNDLHQWFELHPPQRKESLALGYFYPGSDLMATRPSAGLPADANELLGRLRDRPVFLMVGTVEPRKGHAMVLDAFERLWTEGSAACLVIVGRLGWMSDALAARLRALAARESRLVWLENASDEYLEALYGVVRALIASSEAEGFGLPLLEAAHRGVPVIARDIPVFREVASAFAQYFDGNSVDDLADVIRACSAGAKKETLSVGEAGLSWQVTTARLGQMLLDPDHAQWLTLWKSGQDS
ncbi:glycosyltransferase [Dyella flava]|uniref:Glycosyltransferase n=1 Tax=Dyella flava TaxID=1920170 RepID=A0ABS2K2Q5_9GAMM|nr:glycosyltransferase [Dyella flava]MBM7124598.1 glycosyltransferase [Dyella flava]GLQ49251.1 mannosyltransferase A [Dyella flava]